MLYIDDTAQKELAAIAQMNSALAQIRNARTNTAEQNMKEQGQKFGQAQALNRQDVMENILGGGDGNVGNPVSKLASIGQGNSSDEHIAKGNIYEQKALFQMKDRSAEDKAAFMNTDMGKQYATREQALANDPEVNKVLAEKTNQQLQLRNQQLSEYGNFTPEQQKALGILENPMAPDNTIQTDWRKEEVNKRLKDEFDKKIWDNTTEVAPKNGQQIRQDAAKYLNQMPSGKGRDFLKEKLDYNFTTYGSDPKRLAAENANAFQIFGKKPVDEHYYNKGGVGGMPLVKKTIILPNGTPKDIQIYKGAPDDINIDLLSKENHMGFDNPKGMYAIDEKGYPRYVDVKINGNIKSVSLDQANALYKSGQLKDEESQLNYLRMQENADKYGTMDQRKAIGEMMNRFNAETLKEASGLDNSVASAEKKKQDVVPDKTKENAISEERIQREIRIRKKLPKYEGMSDDQIRKTITG